MTLSRNLNWDNVAVSFVVGNELTKIIPEDGQRGRGWLSSVIGEKGSDQSRVEGRTKLGLSFSRNARSEAR